MLLAYAPPKLPTYLASTFDLNPVVGVPTDDEVKTIHAVIRAVENASQIPALRNPDLSMELAQHLFDVQMARYRNNYPVNIFPSSNTYTPPTLPSHISIPLEPITGPPSDDETKLVHTALRASENLSDVPSMFDPNLSMNLSQHLFDIQFARHIQRSTEGKYTTRESIFDTDANQNVKANILPSPAEHPRVPGDYASDTEPAAEPKATRGELVAKSEQDGGYGVETTCSQSLDAPPGMTALVAGMNSVVEQLKVNHDQTDRLMAGIPEALKDGLKDVTRLMIKLHNHSARGSNSGVDYIYHHVVNENGEAPMHCRVPDVRNSVGSYFWSNMSDSEVAEYLNFYNIGLDLVQQGSLKPGSKEAACIVLGKYTHSRGV